MKKIKMFILAFVAVFACVGMVACSSDDDNNEPQDLANLIGSVWQGTNNANKYSYTITIKNSEKYNFKIVDPSGNTYEDKDWNYTYNNENGVFTASYYTKTYTGTISGNTMTMNVDGTKVVLAKK